MISTLNQLSIERLSHGIAMERFYEFSGISRQAYFQSKERLKQYQRMLDQLTKLVVSYRSSKDFRAGSRSLYYNLDIKSKFDIGVTKFEQIMSKHRLSLKQLRVRIITTKSTTASRKYNNLINGFVVTGVCQLVVGDLTYINFWTKRYYLFCLRDIYSSRIVGYSLSQRMRAQDAQVALTMLVKLRGKPALKGCIHHTDGGSQYFSERYLGQMNDLHLTISRAENCLQNGYAEQINGLLKNHLIPLIKSPRTNFVKAIDKLIYIYNTERKQQRLGWLSPIEFEMSLENRKDVPKIKLYNFEQ